MNIEAQDRADIARNERYLEAVRKGETTAYVERPDGTRSAPMALEDAMELCLEHADWKVVEVSPDVQAEVAKVAKEMVEVPMSDLQIVDGPVDPDIAVDPSQIKVEASINPPTEEERAELQKRNEVWRCPEGHEQHGPCETVVTSKQTEQVIARSGPVCQACLWRWIGRKFATRPVNMEAEKKAIARAISDAEAKRVRKLAKQKPNAPSTIEAIGGDPTTGEEKKITIEVPTP